MRVDIVDTANTVNYDTKIKMPELDVKVRIRCFDEVALGYTDEMAMQEALRCYQCNEANCIDGCPVNIDIPAFIKAIAEGDFEKAAMIIRDKNALPAICGRVCPQETQCEIKCIECGNCWLYCPEGCIEFVDGLPHPNYDYCKGCGICAEECPTGAITMVVEVK